MATQREDDQDDTGPHTHRRKRRRIAESARQRSTIACSNCRRLKEKCDGKIPCERCSRHGRQCEVKPAAPRKASPTDPQKHIDDEAERVMHLEHIARHFLGNVPLTAEHLRGAVSGLHTQSSNGDHSERADPAEELDLEEERFTVKTVSQNTVHYCGELSHWSFSQKIRDHVDKRLRGKNYQDLPVLDYWRASHLRSEDWIPFIDKQNLPPLDVAIFLTQIYFDYAQVNDFYVSRDWLYEKLDLLYSFTQRLAAEDAAWIAIVLMTMAVGSQFAHMTEKGAQELPPLRNGEDEATENAVGMTLFHLSCRLVPDMIAVASVESMQACMLLAHFALPLDTPCMAYSYFGLALKIAIQNGLHRGYRGTGHSEETLDLRNRLFWTAYRLDTRVSVLHGRPPSLRSTDIDVSYPSDTPPSGNEEDAIIRRNENVATKLTEWLLDFANSIHMLRRCPKRLRSAYLERLLQTRHRFKQWWTTQPTSKVARQHLSRPEAHSHLCYNLNLVFMGRPFMFTDSKESQHTDVAKSSSAQNELVQDAIAAAFDIIDVCAVLDSSTGLARASYVEFSSIRAALLAILAQSLNERTARLRDKLALGMRLLRGMAVGILSTRCEASVIGAMEAAVRQLEDNSGPTGETPAAPQTTEAQSGEVKYQKWTSLWQDHPESHDTVEQPSPLPSGIDPTDMRDFLGDFDWSPFDPSLLDGDFAGMTDLLSSTAEWPLPLPVGPPLATESIPPSFSRHMNHG